MSYSGQNARPRPHQRDVKRRSKTGTQHKMWCAPQRKTSNCTSPRAKARLKVWTGALVPTAQPAFSVAPTNLPYLRATGCGGAKPVSSLHRALRLAKSASVARMFFFQPKSKSSPSTALL